MRNFFVFGEIVQVRDSIYCFKAEYVHRNLTLQI